MKLPGVMARPLRIEYPGAMYHVMARGHQGRAIFEDDRDRRRFLETLGEACGKTGWRVHTYLLMGNHYHLLLQTPEANLVAGMKWLQGTYTQRFNGRHQVFGHLFQGRYKAVPVEAANAGYVEAVSTYVHGGEGFAAGLREHLEKLLRGRRRESHSGAARVEHGEAAAEHWLQQGLAALGLRAADLAKPPKVAVEKAALAVWLRERTTVALRWVSEHLQMGHDTNAGRGPRRPSPEDVRQIQQAREKLENLDANEVTK